MPARQAATTRRRQFPLTRAAVFVVRSLKSTVARAGAPLVSRLQKIPRVVLVMLGLLLALLAALAVALQFISPAPQGREVTLSQLDRLAESGRVESVQLLDQEHTAQAVLR